MIIYEVHSDTNENNIYNDFSGRGAKQAALSYAKRNIEFQTWVDRVEIDDETEECIYAETVWSYDEEDWNEEAN